MLNFNLTEILECERCRGDKAQKAFCQKMPLTSLADNFLPCFTYRPLIAFTFNLEEDYGKCNILSNKIKTLVHRHTTGTILSDLTALSASNRGETYSGDECWKTGRSMSE